MKKANGNNIIMSISEEIKIDKRINNIGQNFKNTQGRKLININKKIVAAHVLIMNINDLKNRGGLKMQFKDINGGETSNGPNLELTKESARSPSDLNGECVMKSIQQIRRWNK